MRLNTSITFKKLIVDKSTLSDYGSKKEIRQLYRSE